MRPLKRKTGKSLVTETKESEKCHRPQYESTRPLNGETGKFSLQGEQKNAGEKQCLCKEKEGKKEE